MVQGEMKASGSFIDGFKSLISAFDIISEHKGLVKYFIIPFLLNIIILSGIFYFSYSSVYPWLSGLLTGDSIFISIIKCFLKPFLIILLGIITILIYSIAGSIITSPFNDLLSLKVEETITGETFDERFFLSVFINDIIRIIKNIIKLLGIFIAANLVLLLINFLPLIGSVIFSVLSFLLTAFFFGFQFFDFPLERRRMVFTEKLKITWKFKSIVIGLGTSFFIISFIPLVGFLGLNLATIGATTLFIDHIKPVIKTGEY